MENKKTITIAHLAKLLEIKKINGQSIVLFLGSRAGGLFLNETFYSYIERLSTSDTMFNKLTVLEKFSESYRVLNELTESSIFDVLYGSLKNIPFYRREDECLVELLLEGYFDVIISTNIDDFLELTFALAPLREPYHYQIIIPNNQFEIGRFPHEAHYFTLLKVFGDFALRNYNGPGNGFQLFSFENERIRDFLESNLAKNILVVGFDPIWDAPIEPTFRSEGGDIWYVNEELPAADSYIGKTLERRRGRYFVGVQGSYKEFIQALHLALIGRDPIRLENLVLELIDRDSDRIKTFFKNYIEVRDTTSSATKIEKERRLKVFICHSSGDKIAVRDLYQHLKTSNVDPWLDEENLLAGQNWEYEIRQAVRATDVVIVCLSHGSVNKTGFLQREIKFALDVADEQPEDSIFLIPVKLEDCEVPERLRHLQWVNLFEENGYNKLIHALQSRASTLEVLRPLSE